MGKRARQRAEAEGPRLHLARSIGVSPCKMFSLRAPKRRGRVPARPRCRRQPRRKKGRVGEKESQPTFPWPAAESHRHALGGETSSRNLIGSLLSKCPEIIGTHSQDSEGSRHAGTAYIGLGCPAPSPACFRSFRQEVPPTSGRRLVLNPSSARQCFNPHCDSSARASSRLRLRPPTAAVQALAPGPVLKGAPRRRWPQWPAMLSAAPSQLPSHEVWRFRTSRC